MFLFVCLLQLLFFLPCGNYTKVLKVSIIVLETYTFSATSDACTDLGILTGKIVAVDDSCFEVLTSEETFEVARTQCGRHETGHLANLNETQIDRINSSGIEVL